MSKIRKHTTEANAGRLHIYAEEPAAIYHTHGAYFPEDILPGNLLKRALEFLGIRSIKSTEPAEDAVWISLIRKGLQKSALEELMAITGFSNTEMASLVRTTDRTLRRYSSSDVLQPELSERVVEIARLYSRGEEVMGSLEAFRQWMDTPVMAFGQKKPKEYLDTSIGIDLIAEELGRIEQGIFS